MSSEQQITVRYFALLREQRGLGEERLTTGAGTVSDLYGALREEHGFSLESDQLRVVVNEEFCDWDRAIQAGDTVVFVPPVAGG